MATAGTGSNPVYTTNFIVMTTQTIVRDTFEQCEESFRHFKEKYFISEKIVMINYLKISDNCWHLIIVSK